MADENIFSTRDLTLAATLITLKFRKNRTDIQIEGSRHLPVCYWGFDETPSLEDAVAKYHQQLLAVEPKTLAMNMRELKAEAANYFLSPHSKIGNKNG